MKMSSLILLQSFAKVSAVCFSAGRSVSQASGARINTIGLYSCEQLATLVGGTSCAINESHLR